MQVTPVTVPIKFTIHAENNTMIRPIIANVMVCLAPSACFGSPLDRVNFTPEIIIKISAVTPTAPKPKFIRYLIKVGKQPNVITWFPSAVVCVHPV